MTLQQRIERIRRQAQNGVVSPGELVRLLDEVSAVIQAQEARVSSAIRSLSYTEEEMIRALLDALPGEDGGVVVTAHVAEACGASRSGITTAIRKLEAAGVLEARSKGSRGTVIRLIGTTRSDLRQYLGGAA